ncbi:Metallo-beta-lactamase superfamily protein [Burkholderia sp. 8Y]|uniref:MBL fold metallo-hydrolase n=1 Tax=Burkholderia sp. 8Y TaxID=2653133 RepID=UPI0012F1B83E|nr:MBL fold metallo-hydrolase [Burkholderia sp. 8Y]VXC39499.1 Metallo-beta-lactamase superfamily protein [Burkholderia sp. 8Y]
MNSDESTVRPALSGGLHYPFDAVPFHGDAIEVAPGVLWMRLPLPASLDHVNVWALEDGDGWAIVDTGLFMPDAPSRWEALLAGPLGSRRITRVFATHHHADHAGMAGWLARRFDCEVWMTRAEYLTCRAFVAEQGRDAPEDAVHFYRRAGWRHEMLDKYRSRYGVAAGMVFPLADCFRRIEDGQTIEIGKRRWRVKVGLGHSPEHACLYCPELNVLISGDHVLPRISSNVSVHPVEPDANPLGEWLASLTRFARALPVDALVLPSHNEPFHGLHERIERLDAGVRRGLGRLRDRLWEPRRAVDVFGTLFAGAVQEERFSRYTLATGEALAYLNYLLASGESTSHADDDGVLWYRMRA